MAEEATLDLVQVTDSDPIVCKIMDYGKKIFDEKKAKAAAKKKQKQTQVKELKFRPGTEEGDYQVKLRNLVRFLENGDRGKITIRFRGREMAHQEIGMQLMQRIEADIEELVQTIMKLGTFAEKNASRLIGAEINPLIVRAKGKGVIAADALIHYLDEIN